MSKLMDLIKAKKADLNASNRQKAVAIAAGKNRYRILPSWRKDADGNHDPEEVFFHDFGMHFIKGADGQVKAAYVCTDKTFGKPCQVCDQLSMLITQTIDDATLKLLNNAKAGQRYLVNALHVDGKEPTTPVLLSIPKTVLMDIMSAIENNPTVPFLSLDNGHDFIIEKTGGGIDTSYTVSPSLSPSKVPHEVMKKVVDLDEYVKQESDQQLQRTLLSMRNVSGLLPPPNGAVAAPAAPALNHVLADDHDVTADIPWNATEQVASAPEPAAAVPPPAAPVQAAKPAAPPPAPKPAPAAVPSTTGDPELDALIASVA